MVEFTAILPVGQTLTTNLMKTLEEIEGFEAPSIQNPNQQVHIDGTADDYVHTIQKLSDAGITQVERLVLYDISIQQQLVK